MYNENKEYHIYYQPLRGLSDLIFASITSLPNVLFKPLTLQAENVFQLIQSIENIMIVIFLIIFTKIGYNQNKYITLKWSLYTFFILTLYRLAILIYPIIELMIFVTISS